MKKVYLLSISLFICMQSIAQPNNLKRMWMAPYVMQSHDAEFSLQIEILDNVSKKDSIQVVFRAGPVVTQDGISTNIATFFDDGLEDDLVANDRIYTASNVKTKITIDADEIKQKPLAIPLRLSEMIFYSGGSGFTESSDLVFPMRWFTPLDVPGVRQVSSNFQHTSYVANVVDEDLEYEQHNLKEAYKTYYDHLPDDRHSMIVVGTEISFFTGTIQGQSGIVSNDIEGIGIRIYDDSDQYHSNGVLEQRIVLRNGYEDGGVLTHELHHRWGIHMPNEFHMSSGGHMSGAFEMNGGGGPNDRIERIVSNGDSTYNVYYNEVRLPGAFSPIDMYLAGYGPLEDIKFPIKVIPNPTNMGWDTDQSTIMYSEDPLLYITKEMFIEKLGIRSPDYLNTRREQRVAMMVRSQRLLTPAELAYFHKIMVEHEKTENSIYSPKSYYDACMGEGRLTTRISDDISSVEKKFVDQNVFKIFPNPASTELFIESFSKDLLIESGQIFNLTGKLVSSFILENESRIDIRDLVPGVYFLNLKTEEGSFIEKFVKADF